MSREELKLALYEAIHEVQKINGTELGELNDEIIPRDHINGFDSFCEITTATALEEKLEVSIGDDNIFVGRENRPLKLHEVVDSLIVKLSKNEKGKPKK